MKKFITLILSIALLATLMPTTMFVNAAQETVKVLVTDDTCLYAGNNFGVNLPGGYGEEIHGDLDWMGFASGEGTTSCAHILLKANLGNISVPEGKAITKVELCITAFPKEGYVSSGIFSGSNCYLYNTTTNWSESTTYMNQWRDEDTFSPKIIFDGISVFGKIDAAPDAVVSYPKNQVTDYTPITMDVTPLFKKAFPDGTLESDSEFSVMASLGSSSYWRTAVVSSENTTVDSGYLPYFNVTIEEIPAISETSVTLPEMVTDNFSLTISNKIDTASVTVNDVSVEESAISVRDNTVTFDYSYDELTEYNVSVDIKDIYGQKFTKSYIFVTRDINGADASGVIKAYISEDTSLVAQSVGSAKYGKYVSGSDALIRWNAFYGAKGAYLLYKIPVGNINVPEDNKITKIELNFSRAFDSSLSGEYSGQYNSAPINFYLADSDWDEQTTYMHEWCPSQTPTTSHTPTMIWDDYTGQYGIIEGSADATYTSNMMLMSSDVPSQVFSFDITSVYEKALADSMLDSNGDFSLLVKVGTSNYWNTFVASSENADKSLRPYITVTVDDKCKEKLTASEFYHYEIGSQTASAINDWKWVCKYEEGNVSNSSIMMRFPLTKSYYDSFVVSYDSKDYMDVQRIYKFDNSADCAGLYLTYNDFVPYIYDDDNLIGAPTAVGNSNVAAIDVTDYANECIADGREYMCLIIATDLYNSAKINAVSPTAVLVKPLETSITLKSSDVKVSGSTLKSIGAKFATVLENEAASRAVLINTTDSVEVENVNFVSRGNTIDVAQPVALDENKSYKIVLKSDAKDIFGETLVSDIEIASFETTVNFTADLLVAESDGTVIDADNFDTITGITSASENDEIYAVCKIMNNYLDDISALIAIAAYNENNKLVSVNFKVSKADAESTKVFDSGTLTIPTGAKTVKAFAWNSIANKPFGKNIEFNVR